eukprot:scaffold23606_cov108-Isochrysis_galbana.AAC.1
MACDPGKPCSGNPMWVGSDSGQLRPAVSVVVRRVCWPATPDCMQNARPYTAMLGHAIWTRGQPTEWLYGWRKIASGGCVSCFGGVTKKKNPRARG